MLPDYVSVFSVFHLTVALIKRLIIYSLSHRQFHPVFEIFHSGRIPKSDMTDESKLEVDLVSFSEAIRLYIE